MNSTAPVLVLRDVRKAFGDTVIIRGVNRGDARPAPCPDRPGRCGQADAVRPDLRHYVPSRPDPNQQPIAG